MPTPTYIPLQTITLGSSASSVTFASIPQTYRDLVCALSVATTTGQGVKFQYNGETATANYSRVFMFGTGSSTSSGSSSGDANAQKLIQTKTSISTAVVQIMDYSATDKHKTILARSGPADDIVFAEAQRWASTSAITSFTILSESVLNANTTISLYGIEA